MTRLFLALAVVLLQACGGGRPESLEADTTMPWVGSWSAAPYGPFPAGPLAGTVPTPLDALTSPRAFPANQAVNQSFRMIIHPSLGGDTLRLRLSNLMGNRPLNISAVRVARRALGPAIVPSSDTQVSFDGQSSVQIQPGSEAKSDAVSLSFAVGEDLAVSFHVAGSSGPMTWHAISFDLQYISPPNAGDVTSDVLGTAFTEPTIGWFFLSGVDVLRPDAAGAVVALGDSITDGAYQVPTTNTRWPDFLARRLQAADIPFGVLNLGLNSNRVTESSPSPNRGPSALERFDRDVLGRSGVRSVIILEGTNDLSGGVLANELIPALQTLVDRSQAAGLCAVLVTIPPRDDVIGSWDRASMEPERQAVNAWIREQVSQAAVAAVVDLEPVLGLPFAPSRPNLLLFTPDLLHPSSLGFQAMADAMPIQALAPPPFGNCTR